jgi:hypothetical protein
MAGRGALAPTSIEGEGQEAMMKQEKVCNSDQIHC